ncbi:unnamed protein product [Ambrosiozyma monospora]|uniref:Unnamed protein product n=1 Tax=Ambrosiozyma monospora TaxID=43982 RepID=A0ACB5UBS1_AMBMO|nr:unnamed protein product [Ambrosiozyma monospora]
MLNPSSTICLTPINSNNTTLSYKGSRPMNKSAIRANLLNEGGYPPMPGSSRKQRPGPAPGPGAGANNNMNMNNNNMNMNMGMNMGMPQQQQRPNSASSQHRQGPRGPRGPGGPGAAYNQRPIMNQGPMNQGGRPFPPNQGMMRPPQQQQVSQPHGFITHPLQQTDIYDQQQQQQHPPPQNYPPYNNQQQQYE